jgi:hypothetical protein
MPESIAPISGQRHLGRAPKVARDAIRVTPSAVRPFRRDSRVAVQISPGFVQVLVLEKKGRTPVLK